MVTQRTFGMLWLQRRCGARMAGLGARERLARAGQFRRQGGEETCGAHIILWRWRLCLWRSTA